MNERISTNNHLIGKLTKLITSHASCQSANRLQTRSLAGPGSLGRGSPTPPNAPEPRCVCYVCLFDMFGVGGECKNGATVVCWAKVGDGDVDGGLVECCL